jgi:hypothetical protein
MSAMVNKVSVLQNIVSNAGQFPGFQVIDVSKVSDMEGCLSDQLTGLATTSFESACPYGMFGVSDTMNLVSTGQAVVNNHVQANNTASQKQINNGQGFQVNEEDDAVSCSLGDNAEVRISGRSHDRSINRVSVMEGTKSISQMNETEASLFASAHPLGIVADSESNEVVNTNVAQAKNGDIQTHASTSLKTHINQVGSEGGIVGNGVSGSNQNQGITNYSLESAKGKDVAFQLTQQNPEWNLEKEKHLSKKASKSRASKVSSIGPKRTTRVTRGSSQTV